MLISEIGDITRFPNSAKVARYTGCAPIPVYSSDTERYRLHRGGNRRLNSVLYTAAIVQKSGIRLHDYYSIATHRRKATAAHDASFSGTSSTSSTGL